MICPACFGDGGRDVWVDNPVLDNQDWKDCERCKGRGFIGEREDGTQRPLSSGTLPGEREPFDIRCEQMIRVAEEEMRRLES